MTNIISGTAADATNDHMLRSAPTRSSSCAPFMAPSLSNRFIERTDLGRRLLEVLLKVKDDTKNPVVLCGSGGFGKTSLAAWACHQQVIKERFPDGVLWVELGRKPSEQRLASVISDVTAVLTGTRSHTFATVPAAAEEFRNALADRQVLLVVDDAWESGQLAPLLSGGSRCVRLVTTRRQDLVTGIPLTVDAMLDSEARATLSQGLPDEISKAIGPLAARCGRWPLALTMLAGTLRSLINQHRLPAAEAVQEVVAELTRHGITAADQLSDLDLNRGIAASLELSLADLADSTSATTVDRFYSLAAFPQGELIPYTQLRSLWKFTEIRTRIECDRFVSRSLASAVGTTGVRLHDVARDTLRKRDPQLPINVSQAMLDAMRPAAGWHALPEGSGFKDSLAYHLAQAESADEFRRTLLDMRYLVERLWVDGPLALEADIATFATARTDDVKIETLGSMLRQDANLLVGHHDRRGLALTLHTRLACRQDLLEHISDVQEVIGKDAPTALHPFPDQADSALVRTLASHTSPVASIAYNSTEHLLATGGRYDGTIRIWQTSTWSEIRIIRIQEMDLETVRFSPNGKLIAVALKSRKPIEQVPEGEDPDSWLPLLTYDYTIRLFEVDTGTEVLFSKSSNLPDSIVRVAWAPDSTSVAASWNGKVQLYDVADGKPRQMPSPTVGDSSTIYDLDWHDKHGLVALTGKQTVTWWSNPKTSHPAMTWPLAEQADRLAWRPDGTCLLLAKNDGFALLNPKTQTIVCRAQLDKPAHRVSALFWAPDGSSISLAYFDFNPTESKLVTWQVPPDPQLGSSEPNIIGRIACGFADSAGQVKDLAWAPDGNTIATAQARANIWRPTHISNQRFAMTKLSDVYWNPNGDNLAVKHVDGRWALVNPVNPGQPVLDDVPYPYGQQPLPAHSLYDKMQRAEAVGITESWQLDRQPTVAWSPCGDQHATSLWFQPIEIFHQNKLVHTLPMPKATRWSGLCFTPDGTRLVSAAQDGPYTITEFAVWDLRTGQMIANEIPTPIGSGFGMVTCVVASQYHLAAVTYTGDIVICDIKELRPYRIKVNSVLNDATFDPKGDRLAVVGSAGLYLLYVPALWPQT